VIDDPEMVEIFARDGAEAASSTPQQFAAFLKSEQEQWARLVKKAGLQAAK
jgi:tripartite-type tricarboxylate transporter receptor subunit TctC